MLRIIFYKVHLRLILVLTMVLVQIDSMALIVVVHQEIMIGGPGGGSAPRSNPLLFYIPFLTDIRGRTVLPEELLTKNQYYYPLEIF